MSKARPPTIRFVIVTKLPITTGFITRNRPTFVRNVFSNDVFITAWKIFVRFDPNETILCIETARELVGESFHCCESESWNRTAFEDYLSVKPLGFISLETGRCIEDEKDCQLEGIGKVEMGRIDGAYLVDSSKNDRLQAKFLSCSASRVSAGDPIREFLMRLPRQAMANPIQQSEVPLEYG